MPYSPTVWVEKVTAVGPTNLNHLETGLQAAAAVADAALPVPAGSNGQFLKRVGGVWVPTTFGISDIPDPTTGKVIGSSGGVATAVLPPGYEVGYDQITANVTVSSTTEATGTSVIVGSSYQFDGAAVIAEFFSSFVTTAAVVNGIVIVSLFEGATQIGRLAVVQDVAASLLGVPVYGRYRITPSVGAHTYSVTAFQINGNGAVQAGSGGVAGLPPAFLRFTKV